MRGTNHVFPSDNVKPRRPPEKKRIKLFKLMWVLKIPPTIGIHDPPARIVRKFFRGIPDI